MKKLNQWTDRFPEDEIDTVLHDIFIRAALNWDKAEGIDTNGRQWPSWPDSLCEFLGFDARNGGRWCRHDDGKITLVEVPKECVDKFHMLAGPHYETIIKMWKIRQENPDDR